MKTSILSIAAFIVAIIAFNQNALAQAPKKGPKDKILANKVYTVEMVETSNKKVGKKSDDEVSFKSEKMGSKFMTSENHFPPAPYTVTVDSSQTPPVATFTCEGKSSDGEDIKWDGTITGDDIEGTAVISKKGKTKKEYSYNGSLKVKGAKK